MPANKALGHSRGVGDDAGRYHGAGQAGGSEGQGLPPGWLGAQHLRSLPALRGGRGWRRAPAAVVPGGRGR
eukprot:8932338-Lingulodinium_polyedra.AAC.1